MIEQPRIISASRRTDLPAFHSRWFIERIRQGWCEVANPFNAKQVRRVSLLPQDVDGIVFWTRNAAPLMPHLHELDDRGIPYYFLWTITGYPEAIEPRAPQTQAAIGSFCELAGRIGPHRVIWRYDPVILTDVTPATWHEENYAGLCGLLQNATERCVISFVEPYAKTRKALAALAQNGIQTTLPGEHAKLQMANQFAAVAQQHAIALQTCCTPATGKNASPKTSSAALAGPCVDAVLLECIAGKTVANVSDRNQRQHCLCAKSIDIGRYGTCRFGCVYCYARR
ncbi:DUF1848 domain-containing protein [Oleidesulfovibrio sp.]|uniref:DUF1848 domain-containing protein n=1 Tax=Oleidesulfovibrio sp. TaxID=2909707 RepID=UPI003A87F123